MTVISTLVITNITTLVCLLIITIYYKIPNKIIRKIIDNLKKIIRSILEPRHGRVNFMKMVNNKFGKMMLLDVGCGNNSPFYFRTNFPKIKYTGIDVGDYNQTMPILDADYIITSPENFANKICEWKNIFDVVFSSHNLEHCNDRNATLVAMAMALKKGGYLYLSFPTEKSVNFPGPREGTLNYYDDSTHKDKPPNFIETLRILKNNGIDIIYHNKSYKPFFLFIKGIFEERKSKRENKVYYSTWAYYGFEAIIWGKKLYHGIRTNGT